MATKLIYKGDLIENFGEFLPSPYIEQIRLYNERMEVDVSLFLTDKQYGRVVDTTAYGAPTPQDFGASPSSDMGKFLQNYTNASQGKNLAQPSSKPERRLMVYMSFEFCIKQGQCRGDGAVRDQIIKKILNPARERPLYDFLIETEDADGNTPTLEVPFTDFVESDNLLFAEDGTRIVQYKYTYTFYNPVLSFTGGVFGATSTATLKKSGGDEAADFDSGNLVLYGFSSYIPKETFEQMYGSGYRSGIYPATHKRGSDAAIPLYQLAKGQFSDVSYEVILEGGNDSSGTPQTFGNLRDELITWVDDQGAVYPRAPIRDISGRHRKVGVLSGEEIKTEFESMIKEFRQVTTLDEEADNAANEIMSILQTYTTEPKSEIPGTNDNDISAGPAILVMEKLQTLRKMWPNKAQGTTAGKLYYLFKALIGNVQARLAKQEPVYKRKQKNLKIFDLRYDDPDSSYTPGVSDLSVDASDYTIIHTRGLEGSMVKFESQAIGASSMSGKDILDFEFAPEGILQGEPDEGSAKPYTVFRRGYFFVDFEVGLYIHSIINKTFNVPVLERWFGKSMIQSKFIISDVKLEKYISRLDDLSGVDEHIRTWGVEMYSSTITNRSSAPASLRWPANSVAKNSSTLPDIGGVYYDTKYMDGRRYFGHLVDFDESEWGVNPTYTRASGNGQIYVTPSPFPTHGVENSLTTNRIKGLALEDPDKLLYVATPPLPLPKRVYTDHHGHEANLIQVPNNGRGVFPGIYNRQNSMQTNWTYSMMFPRNIAGIGGQNAFNGDVGLETDGYMNRAHATEYMDFLDETETTADDETYSFKTFSPVYNKVGASTVSPSIAPYGYRLMAFEFLDIYAGETNHWLMMETGQHASKTMKYRADVTARDYTAAIARGIMDSYDDVVNGAFLEYVEMATEYCAYNQIDDAFTAYFADAITDFYREHYVWETPWFKAPFVFFLHRDLLFQQFGGGTKAAKEEVITSALNLAEKISPYTGTLSALLAFQAEMQELYDGYYGPGGIIADRLETLEEYGEGLGGTGDGVELNWRNKIRFHTGDDDDVILDTTSSDAVPWPVDVTQQGDVEEFAEWDVVINEFDHDPVCMDGVGPGSVTDGSTYESYLGACTKDNGLVPIEYGEGDDMDYTMISPGDGIDNDKRYFFPGVLGWLSGDGPEGSVTGNTHDFTNRDDFGLDGTTHVGDRLPHYSYLGDIEAGDISAESRWAECYCHCLECTAGYPVYCQDGGWINVVRIVCPEDDRAWPVTATENMRNHIIVPGSSGGLGYDSPYGISADVLSGPEGACYALAAVDTNLNDKSINSKFLDSYKRHYAGIKVYEGTALDTLDGAAEITGVVSITEGDYEGLDVRLYTELTRHPSGGSARSNPDGGRATEGDNGQKALGFCIMCRGDETSMPLNWLPRDGMTAADTGGPRIDCRDADVIDEEDLPGENDPPGIVGAEQSFDGDGATGMGVDSTGTGTDIPDKIF